MSKEWKKLGSLRKGKTGSLYLKFDDEVTLKKGDVLQLQDPRKRIATGVEAGRLKEDKAEELLSKIPEYIKYEVIKAPTEG